MLYIYKKINKADTISSFCSYYSLYLVYDSNPTEMKAKMKQLYAQECAQSSNKKPFWYKRFVNKLINRYLKVYGVYKKKCLDELEEVYNKYNLPLLADTSKLYHFEHQDIFNTTIQLRKKYSHLLSEDLIKQLV